MEETIEPEAPAAELERLLELTAKGDRDAFSRLYGRTRAAVYATALTVTDDAGRSEELCHDAFLRIWDYASSYRPRGTPMAWILTVTRNLCLMELRREKRGATLTDEERAAIPARSDASAEDREVLQTALGKLKPDERQIVVLHAVSGMKHREIAKLLDLPLGTVLSKYRRAIEKLRGIMEGE